ncbi:MAG: hypothetical protein ACRC67_14270 [Inquilinus sp.]|uniref:hypothetical protein n=1 Tax=Inquilinus sp. TaxID=1932117 RepID=UPI003F3D44AB
MSTEIIRHLAPAGLPATETLAPNTVLADKLVEDTVLGERLGYEHPRQIRRLIAANRDALEAMGDLYSIGTDVLTSKGARHKVTVYHLTRAQAAFLVSKARTKRADSLAIVIAEVFALFTEGGLVAKDAEAVAKLDAITERARERDSDRVAMRAASRIMRRGRKRVNHTGRPRRPLTPREIKDGAW